MSSEQRKRFNISLLIPFLVVALVFGLLIWQKYQSSREVPPRPQIQQPAAERKAVLFFVADGNRLTREARALESCDGTDACVKTVLEELFNGPVGDLDEAIPEGAAFNGVHVEGDTAVVDLNRSFAGDLPAGSSAEMLAVYSIVDTICVNFPQIAKVKLTIEGKGDVGLEHLDLSEPLTPDYALEQGFVPPETGKPSHTSTSTTKKGHP